MKNKKIFKTLSALCAALVLMMGLSVTAFAQGTEELPAEDATNDSNVVVEETEDSPALTPDGNAALVDDFGDNKQLITVTTKAGNYFYILIDRANEDKETAVHFLNQVDEADLMALMEDGQTTQEQPATCTCTEKCVAGAVNTACPVCATNMSACTGKEPEPETPEETPEPEEPAAEVFVFRENVPLSAELQEVLWDACQEHKVEYALALGLIETESSFNPEAVSYVGCYGLMQLNPDYFPTDLSPAENIQYGVAFIAEKLDQYAGNVGAALTAYNAGHDTGNREYAEKVMAAAERWRTE